ncbi:hypothetical protein Cpap_1283 [Ruminiclostridium papyrosolvens DSM 2782]|uniref:Primosome, DnaD subunit n=1 Tax=Ruminiclostridium papyrosolvens DSM 2782 TaxID=588581 RepID=F1TFL2_9FIRM|nr:hypothetical protein [Ruminiclostridium papyrosolvens]EGD46744.1 hypothetical protein Cpap_1283 [Ruminiclostridium papyrosolvens DSM 2782]WES34914.1 hypothetical protein P0092_02740 [Ruminiclostridium papyrosolvens DSM 2782]
MQFQYTGGGNIQGFIKEYRNIVDHWVFQDAYAFKVWNYILLSAAYKDYKKPCKGTMVTIHSGQLIYGRPEWSRLLNIPEGKLRSIIDLLKQDSMITLDTVGRRYSVITVVNWEKYQSNDILDTDRVNILQNITNETTNYNASNDNALKDIDNQQNNQQKTNREPNKKNIKNIKNIKELKDIYVSNPKTQKFVPPTLEEVQDYCQERNNSVDAEKFVDHYIANGWMRGKSKVKDWKACVRTWEKNSTMFSSQKNEKPSNRSNFEQREYGDEYFDGFFNNTG